MKKTFSLLLNLMICTSMLLPNMVIAGLVVPASGTSFPSDGGVGGGGLTGGTSVGSSGGSSGGSSAGSSGGASGSAAGGSSGGSGSCYGVGQTVPSGSVCCSGLIPDANKVCINDPSPVDPTVNYTTCSGLNDTSTCQGRLSCLPQTMDSFFKYAPQSLQEELQKEQHLAEFDNDEPKDSGESCSAARECLSYNCVPNNIGVYRCKEKFICRLGDDSDENLPVGTVCEKDLIFMNGKCVPVAGAVSPNSGILDAGDIELTALNRCSEEMDLTSKNMGTEALINFRVLEWFVTNTNASQDCMYNIDYIKQEIAPIFNNERREILKQFNIMMSTIEQDQQVLMAAIEDKNKQLQIMGNIESSYVVATRRESGKDMMRLMILKNNAYIYYETQMMALAVKVSQKVNGLLSTIAGFPDHREKFYNILGGVKSHRTRTCRGGHFLGTGRRKIFKRWNKRLFVPTTMANANAVTKSHTLPELKLMTGESEQDIVERIFSLPLASISNPRPHWYAAGTYMFDPMIEFGNSGLSHQVPNVHEGTLGNFPQAKQVMAQDFLAYLRSIKNDLSSAYLVNPDMQAFINTHLKDDKENLKIPVGFIAEPELIPQQSKNCIEADGPLCTQAYKDFVAKFSDVALATQIMWSLHGRDNYKFYFRDERTWRRKLLKFWDKQMLNAGTYYTKKLEMRVKQNNCLQDAIKYVDQNFLDGSGNGIAEGGNNYYQENDYTVDGGHSTPKKNNVGREQGRLGKFDFTLTLDSFKLNSNTAIKDSLSRALASSDGAFSGASSALASRMKEIKEANDKLAAKGVNIADKDKAYKETLNSMASSKLGAGSMNQGLGGGAGAMGAGGKSGMGNLGADAMAAANSGKEKDKNKDKKSKDGLGDGSNGEINKMGGNSNSNAFGSGFGANSGSGSGSGNYQDPTGMSDEEKDVVMANIDRNRSKYQPNEDDSIFTIISKQYANSLPKILTRKKADD